LLLLAVASSLGLAALSMALSDLRPLSTLESTTLAWRFQWRGAEPPPDSVAVIAIDEATLAAYGRWPLPRRLLGEAVVRLRAAGAAAIGLDILLLEPEPPYGGTTLSPGDQELLGALRGGGDTAMAMALGSANALALSPAQGRLLERESYGYRLEASAGSLQPPRAASAMIPLTQLAQASALGHVNLQLTGDGMALRLHPAVELGGGLMPGFSTVMSRLALGEPQSALGLAGDGQLLIGARRWPLDVDLGHVLSHYGPAGTITTYSLADLLEGAVPSEALAGRAVLIGATAQALGDRFATPFATAVPGVEVLATGVANLLDDKQVIRTAETRLIDTAAVFLLALLGWSLGFLLGPRLAIFAGTLALLGWLFLTAEIFVAYDLWIAMTLPAVALVFTTGLSAALRVNRERRLRRQAQKERRNLARYVSPLIADALAERTTPSFDKREQQAAILFVDLAGFTGASEAQSPKDTVAFLRDYHRRIERVVLDHGGVIEQFSGDGAMVIFGLPEPRADDAVRALACARALLALLALWRPAVTARAGLHLGPVVIAQLGGKSQAQLAAAGDTVNVASRLESKGKDLGKVLVISDEAATAVEGAERPDLLAGLSRLSDQTIRGRDRGMTLWVADRAGLGLAAAGGDRHAKAH